MVLLRATRSSHPWGHKIRTGAVPTEAVVSAHGAHLHQQATEDQRADGVGGPPTAFPKSPVRPVGAAIPQPSTVDDLRDAKRALRAIARERRRAAAAAGVPAAAVAVRDRFLAAIPVPAGTAVSAYWPLAEELDVRALVAALDAVGAVVALPVIAGRDQALAFRRWRPGLALVGAVFGTYEPPRDAPAVVPAIVIVPLLAFDRAGHRLGYGAGFYDRTLRALRAPACGRAPVLAVGVGVAAQDVAHVPHGPGDERLDWIVTEQAARRVE